MPFVTVVIPTRNRVKLLDSALNSILNQTLCSDLFEIIVVDNGSTDKTKEAVNGYVNSYSNVYYYFEKEPGLHVGRHVGAQKANGEVLVFCDDDIIATPCWLESIHDAFKDSTVALVGGKVLPEWEGAPPRWIEQFKKPYGNNGWSLGHLSLVDFGDQEMDFDPCYVYGCNYAIRKDILYQCGGFRPDAMPQELIRYRGDGETGLSMQIAKKGLRSVYVPTAMVYHRVPLERLTVEYFCRRAFNQGVSDSYTEIRCCGAVCFMGYKKTIRAFITSLEIGIAPIKTFVMGLFSSSKQMSHKITVAVKTSYRQGYAYHRKEVRNDPELLAYVIREHYY